MPITKLFGEEIDGQLFEVYSASSLEPPPAFESKFFRLALLIDGSQYSNDEIFGFADECLRRGLCYLVAWGPDCERVHDLFDEHGIDEFGNDRFRPPSATEGL